MQQIYRRPPTTAWVFSCKFAAYFQNTFLLRTPLGGCIWGCFTSGLFQWTFNISWSWQNSFLLEFPQHFPFNEKLTISLSCLFIFLSICFINNDLFTCFSRRTSTLLVLFENIDMFPCINKKTNMAWRKVFFKIREKRSYLLFTILKLKN